MPDLRERLHRLAEDVTDLPRPPAADVRRRAERRRRTQYVAAAAAVTAAAVATFATVAYVRDDAARVAAAPSASATAPPASPTTSPPALVVAPWLPAPWVLDSATSYTWPASEPSTYRFCGRPYVPHWPVTVREQRLAHPDGGRALLLEISPAPEDPYQIFKWSYASCRVEGRAEGVGGPRNLWSYGTLAAGSEPVGARVHVLEMTEGTRDDVASALDAWAGR